MPPPSALGIGRRALKAAEARMDEVKKERRLGAARAALAQAMDARGCAGKDELEWGGRDCVQENEPARRQRAVVSDSEESRTAPFGAGDIETEARRRLFVRMTLIEDYRLSSAFIPVPKLAVILGMSPSTIWSHMRQKKFPIPYRVFNTTPMVCIDDLVDWYCAKDDLILPDEAPAPRRSAKQEAEEARRRRDAETKEIVADALASLGINTRRRRG